MIPAVAASILTTVNLPLGEFALPVPRRGSLESHAGSGPSAAQGQEIHQRVQRARAKEEPGYRAEVAVTGNFERGSYRFQVKGRMDGICDGNPVRIEEIKSTFSLRELAHRLEREPDHPYCLQLKTYGYLHWQETGTVPQLEFLLVSTRNARSLKLPVELDLAWYRDWLELRLEQLVREAARAEARGVRRRRVAQSFPFPFPVPRPGQQELMAEVEAGMALELPLLLQAPTGLGKTAGVLYPVLREALGRGQQVVYVTPKNSQHAMAEDAVERFRAVGAPLRSLSITAKGKICLKEEPLCQPEYCEYARDYYGKLAALDLAPVLGRKKKLKARHFRELAQTHELCPFELQLEALPEADVVICDYNYVFAPRSALGRVVALEVGKSGLPNLVIDEAHNLPARAMDYYSPELSARALAALGEGLGELPGPFAAGARKLLAGCLSTLASCGEGRGEGPRRIEPPVAPFLAQDASLKLLLARYLESSAEIVGGDPLLALCRSWTDFAQTLELARDAVAQEFCTTFHPGREGGVLKITCCDASSFLKDCYAGFRQVVGFSATLKPFDYYARLSGLDPQRIRTAEFASPFPPSRRKLLVIPQVSTRYAERERNYGRIADALERIVALRPGNYLACFPSFAFLERVAELFRAPEGFEVLRQERSMSQARCEAVLERLRAGGAPVVLFAVQGGSFAEGVDYQGDMMIGAFVVGAPLPNFDLERELLREYYQRRFGAGFQYAYAIPAMAKAVQAAGRVIRSESDRGVVVLMDSRFLEPGFSSSMPADWFQAEVGELVSGTILKEISQFWDRHPSAPPQEPPTPAEAED